MATDETPTNLDETEEDRPLSMRQVARLRRWFLWSIFILLFIYIFGFPFAMFSMFFNSEVPFLAITIALLITYQLIIVGVVLASTALGAGRMKILFLGFLAAIPYLNLIALIGVAVLATRLLQHAGIRVGIWANRGDIERVMNSLQCSECGYNLFGNVSGRCPECGREIANGNR